MNEIKRLRTKVDDVIFKNPPGKHGGFGSIKAHNEILDLIDNSFDYITFKNKLIATVWFLTIDLLVAKVSGVL